MTVAPVVIVGAGLAGWRVADGIAQIDPRREVVLLGAEQHPPYDRPPLSKQALSGTRSYDDLVLGRASESDSLELRLGQRVVGSTGTAVHLESGESVAADQVVWATGVQPVRPDWVPVAENVHVLRTIDDSQRLGAQLRPGGSLVVIGGGFIGCELAASAVGLGVAVTVIEMADALLAGAVHAEIGNLVQALHEERGVAVRTGERVQAMSSSDGRVTVTTDCGTYTADTAVIGVGARVDTGPLASLPTELGGIACDRHGRVEGQPGIWAVGDLASWHEPVLGFRRRREHWTTATAQASVVAHLIAGAAVPDALLHQPPYAWSDQYDVKVQVLGWPEAAERSSWIDRDGATGAIGFYAGDERAGVATIGAPRLLMKHRAAINAFTTSRLVAP